MCVCRVQKTKQQQKKKHPEIPLADVMVAAKNRSDTNVSVPGLFIPHFYPEALPGRCLGCGPKDTFLRR